MSGALHGVVTAVAPSKTTMRNIRQNLFFALFYNGIGIPVAAGALYPLLGWRLSPMIAAAAMAASSLSAVGNANRLRRFRRESPTDVQPPPGTAASAQRQEPVGVTAGGASSNLHRTIGRSPVLVSDGHHEGN